jgi:hypothetical protein
MEPRDDLRELLPVALEVIGATLHLYAVSAVYWALIATFLVLRYGLDRRTTSDRLRLPIVGLGVLAVVVAAVDVLVRGEAGVTHVSLVAYLATPVGIGRYLVARWDRRPAPAITALKLRLLTYAIAFVAFVVLSALNGEPWFFDRPNIDRSSPEAMVEHTAWMPFMATVFGLLLALDAASSLGSLGWERAKVIVQGSTRGAGDPRWR